MWPQHSRQIISDIGFVTPNIIRRILWHLIPWLIFRAAQNPSLRLGFIHASLISQGIRVLHQFQKPPILLKAHCWKFRPRNRSSSDKYIGAGGSIKFNWIIFRVRSLGPVVEWPVTTHEYIQQNVSWTAYFIRRNSLKLISGLASVEPLRRNYYNWAINENLTVLQAAGECCSSRWIFGHTTVQTEAAHSYKLFCTHA